MKIKRCQMCNNPTTKKLCMACVEITSEFSKVARTDPGTAMDAAYYLADQIGFDLDELIREEALI